MWVVRYKNHDIKKKYSNVFSDYSFNDTKDLASIILIIILTMFIIDLLINRPAEVIAYVHAWLDAKGSKIISGEISFTNTRRHD